MSTDDILLSNEVIFLSFNFSMRIMVSRVVIFLELFPWKGKLRYRKRSVPNSLVEKAGH